MKKKILSIAISGVVALTANSEYLLKQSVKSGVADSFVVDESSIYEFTSHTFTTCGVTGRGGPIESQCKSTYNTTWDESNANFTVQSTGKQLWTVPISGSYKITVAGAGRGQPQGGKGAVVSKTLSLQNGEKIQLAVGQRATCGSASCGGSGGSFVVKEDNTPIVIAGGGGGTYYMNNSGSGGDASYTENGVNGSCGAVGGTNGQGGSGGQQSSPYGNGGGGFYSNGGTAANCPNRYGLSWNNGLTGGNTCNVAVGGFGGGGGTHGSSGGAGGGGGYSGGGGTGHCGTYGGGGGSFGQDENVGYNNGEGYITIEKL